MTDRERLHALVDVLPDGEVHTALRFVEYLRNSEEDPVLRALRKAPLDLEPLTEEDIAALSEAKEDEDRAHLIPHEEIHRRVMGEG